MTRLTASQLSDDVIAAVSRVAATGERIVLCQNRQDVAALVSMDDLALLEQLEDRSDCEAADEALAEMKAKGETPIPWDEAKQRLA